MGSLYTKAIAETLGADIGHEVRSCLENSIEQSCQKIKQRYYTTLGLGWLEVRDDFAKQLMKCSSSQLRTRMAGFVYLFLAISR
jgi:transposase-like protein